MNQSKITNKRILSGIQPSGVLHIGNYFGAIRQHIELQKENDCLYFIANYHAMTTIADREMLKAYSLMVAMDYLALGFDAEQAGLFMQSDVPEVAELAWMLSTVTPMGLLERAHSYKDKISKGISPNHGLFAYPTLMAADILIYDSEIVPVGKDQKQHLEITRDVAEKFNLLYGNVLVIPDAYILPQVAVVPGVDGQKMSKSYGNTIEIFSTYKEMKKNVMRIVTDSTPLEAAKDPDNSVIVDLYKLVASPEEVGLMREKFLAGGYGYGHAKKELLEKLWTYFEPHRQRRQELSENPDVVEEVLRKGAERARARAVTVMDRVRDAVGLLRFR